MASDQICRRFGVSDPEVTRGRQQRSNSYGIVVGGRMAAAVQTANTSTRKSPTTDRIRLAAVAPQKAKNPALKAAPAERRTSTTSGADLSRTAPTGRPS